MSQVNLNGTEFSRHPTPERAHAVAMHLWAVLEAAGRTTGSVDAWTDKGALLFLNGRSTRIAVGLRGPGFAP